MNPNSIVQLVSMEDRLAASVKLGSVWISSTDEERAKIIQGWPHDVEWPYPSPWRLACTREETGQPRDRIVASLVLNGIESTEEARDQAFFHCVAYHGCLLSSLDPNELFTSVARTLPRSPADALHCFLKRSPEDQALDAFLLEKHVDRLGETELRMKE